MATNEQILDLVRQRGPILPIHVSKHINDNLLMTSARLSELLSNKKLKISNIKVGGSPLYYVDGQETKLQNYADNLGGKEKEAYNLLKEKKVLRDSALEPAIRVALRMIKDFSIALNVNYENKTEIFWKWYLTPNNEVQPIINEILSKKEPAEETKPQTEIRKEIQQEIMPETITNEQIPGEKHEAIREEAKKPEQKERPEAIKEAIKKEIAKPKQKTDKALFLRQISNFFDKSNIRAIETNEVKKNLEIDFVIELRTSIGNVKYFCKTKNKKKINESDLSSAMVQAQSKNLPLLFLTKGKIAKKAEEKLKTDFRNIVYREI